ncbi:MT-A70-domain-containing protein [Ceraceosorus guamensis]|uniref:mRNA m(6)A methyltransferase n=1 Tax=Ceraceosorus guamensis TaxID=1522189 RepID=A0A316VWS4_9BASI|nr:MT-A70-domain-containing protein [Ceraceosorus guamensis]PWN41902.1 MT-A70-domain-containing protein [Ceraceosorus guamensis]
MSTEHATAVQEISSLYLRPRTAKTRLLSELLSAPDTRHQEICQHLTLADCAAASSWRSGHEEAPGEALTCQSVHFEVVMYPQTDLSYGHCSYLNTCHRTTTCKYLHFRPVRSSDASPFAWHSKLREPCPQVYDSANAGASPTSRAAVSEGLVSGENESGPEAATQLFETASVRHPLHALQQVGAHTWYGGGGGGGGPGVASEAAPPVQLPPQWMDVDLRDFDYSMLGKVDVILADPPWDIHMSLPYGTMTDDQMRSMPLAQLQDEGFIFLWVTGRAMELGRELLAMWGYARVDELVWVKVGQTQRLIRTGRTGHWLNHTKEHCLVGAKRKPLRDLEETPQLASPLSNLSQIYPAAQLAGARSAVPSWAHAGLGADVIVSEVRDTSRKPDELYGLIERLCPGGRKIELFGRKHNARPGWITLGNQLKGDRLYDQQLLEKLNTWRAGKWIT